MLTRAAASNAPPQAERKVSGGLSDHNNDPAPPRRLVDPRRKPSFNGPAAAEAAINSCPTPKSYVLTSVPATVSRNVAPDVRRRPLTQVDAADFGHPEGQQRQGDFLHGGSVRSGLSFAGPESKDTRDWETPPYLSTSFQNSIVSTATSPLRYHPNILCTTVARATTDKHRQQCAAHHHLLEQPRIQIH